MCPFVRLALLVVIADHAGLLTNRQCSFYDYARCIADHGPGVFVHLMIYHGLMLDIAAESMCLQLERMIDRAGGGG